MTEALGIGVMLDRSSMLRASDVAGAARHVEELGLYGLFVGDQLAGALPMLDGTILLGAAAAATERIALGFAVMLPVLRHVAWAVKQIATLQQLSGDRLVVGVGSGAPIHGPDAWDALGVPYKQRAARLDAALPVLGDLVSGRRHTFENGSPLALEPAATAPPIWIGGSSPRALRRAAEYGDGWLPSMVAPSRVARGAHELHAAAARLGRDKPTVAVAGVVRVNGRASTWPHAHLGNGSGPWRDEGMPIRGDVSAVAERLDEYGRAGAGHVVLSILGDDWERQCELLAEARALPV